MVGEAIGFFLRHLPAFLFVAALVFASLLRGRGSAAERFLAWILLLPIGVTGLWAGISHIFFPATAAAHIGWQVSPFQFEVGMADLAIGVTACIAFRRELPFQAAAICAASVFLLGDAVGHVREMMVAGNFAPGNADLPFYMDIICPTLAIILVIVAKLRENADAHEVNEIASGRVSLLSGKRVDRAMSPFGPKADMECGSQPLRFIDLR